MKMKTLRRSRSPLNAIPILGLQAMVQEFPSQVHQKMAAA